MSINDSSLKDTFNQIADRYDKCNALLSLGLHKRWYKKLIDEVMEDIPIAGQDLTFGREIFSSGEARRLKTALESYRNRAQSQSEKDRDQTKILTRDGYNISTLLDLCCGTATASMQYLKRREKPCQAFLVDFSEKMLHIAHHRAKSIEKHRLHFIQADVQDLPLPSHSIDAAILAFGIRNLKEMDVALKEVHRVLMPGARFGILELTMPKWSPLRFLYRLYLRCVVSKLGGWISRNKKAYRYLADSIEAFMTPEELEEMLHAFDFQVIKKKRLFFGVVTLIIAKAN